MSYELFQRVRLTKDATYKENLTGKIVGFTQISIDNKSFPYGMNKYEYPAKYTTNGIINVVILELDPEDTDYIHKYETFISHLVVGVDRIEPILK